MKRLYLSVFILITFASFCSAQSVQWASRVVGVSSERKGDLSGEQYRASQTLGHPSKLPLLGETPCAWSPFYADGTTDEWVQVGFETPMRARQIVVAENVNPGSVVKVIVFDEAGAEHVVYQNASTQPRQDPLLRVFPTDTSYVCRSVKVFINGAALKGPNQIDAIGISTATKPVMVTVSVSKETPKDIQKENLGKTINSPGQEVAPVISPDGRTLYFTRNFNKENIGGADHQDVWYSVRESGSSDNPAGWRNAVNMGPPINNAGDNAISGMAPNGRMAYLINVYKPDGNMTFGISRSILTKAGWSVPVECKIDNNYNIEVNGMNQMEFCVSPDGRTIILAVQRKDTRGNRDLYVSQQKPNGSWSEPVSLGRVVNTADAESSPFLAADGRSLYFTSSGHAGFGNGDIFVSRRLDASWGNWSEPENLGPAINTPEWDGYFTIPASGDYAYLSSRAGSMGEDDIFRLKLYPAIKPDPVAIISGHVLDAVSKKPIASSVMSSILGDNTERSTFDYNPEAGEYRIILPTQKTYNLTASREGYFPTTETLNLSKDKRFRDIKRNLYLVKIEPGQKIVMREVLFEQSQSMLQPGGNTELDRIVTMLNEHPTMDLLIEGHTDNQGDWDLNIKLSEDRVRVVKDYLLSHSIAQARIQTKAWGPSKPVASNTNEEKRKQNRRVEFTILKL